MPVLNERAYLEHAIASVLAQDVDAPMELVLALGPSTDGTTELARRLAEADDRIRLVDNPAAHIPVGLNAAIRASRYDTIVRGAAPSARAPRAAPPPRRPVGAG
uniref:glycosyltransferase n=1 Tax=Microbacterium oxydans TaxID=82380 RepID=UPI0024AD5D1E